jgi:hypothetical protein
MSSLARCGALILTVGALFSACGEDVVGRGELEKQVQAKLTESVGQQAPKAVCPDELVAEEGKTTRCHMDFPEGKRLGITVKVKSAEGGTAKFDVIADDKLIATPK